MKEWLLSLLLLFGVVGAWAGDQTPPHKIDPGETLGSIGKRFGYDWRVLCAFNKLDSCHVIQAGATIRFPARDTIIMKRPVELACITLGAAPFNPEHNLARTLQGIDLLTTLTAKQKELAKQKVLLGEKATEKELVGRQIFGEMLYQSQYGKKEVVHLYGKPICASEEGGQPEVMDTYDLGEGVMLSIPRRCGNPSVFIRPTPVLLPPEPPVEAPPLSPPPPASPPVVGVPPEIVVEPPEAVTVARDYDFDGIVWAGGDKNVRHAGTTDAGYPVIKHYDWGRYGLGLGGTISGWQGGTPDGFRFSGLHPAFGVAQKFSLTSRRSVSVKLPMYSDLWTKGHDGSGRYQQKAHAKMWCAALDYTDASREKAGATWFPEVSLSTSYCDPFSQTASHSYDGKEIATPPADIKYVAGVSVEVIIRKNFGDQGLASRWQPTAELGWNKTSPNPISGHAYLGVRSTDKLWSVGVGQNWSSLGKTLGGIVKYNWGRAWVLNVQRERWNKMIQSLEALGVATD